MHSLAAAVSALLLAGCASGPPIQPPQGPTLIVDVANASGAEATFEFEFESEGTSGAGGALLPACRRETLQLSSISGSYRMRVDGAEISEGVVPAAAGEGEFLVIRLVIGPDGEAEAAAPVVLAAPPNVSAAIRGCEGE
jgi:hypothetical protein